MDHPCHGRNIFLYMLCLPKSLSYERFLPRQGGTEAQLSSGVCVCMCVPNARLTAKKKKNPTTFNGILSIGCACLVTVFLLVHMQKEKTFMFFRKRGELKNNCSSPAGAQLRDMRDFSCGGFDLKGEEMCRSGD